MTTNIMSIKDIDMKLEVVVIPVSDVDASREFYQRLGWRLDRTPPGIVQLTPHGSACSVQFGANLTSARPGSSREYLIVSDLEAARDAIAAAGVEISEIFHIGPNGVENGPDPQHRSYFSRATFNDPDGNGWLLQEITDRLPGRVDPGETAFGSTTDLATALRRTAIAHGEFEERTGETDQDWPDWFAKFMANEQTGGQPPPPGT